MRGFEEYLVSLKVGARASRWKSTKHVSLPTRSPPDVVHASVATGRDSREHTNPAKNIIQQWIWVPDAKDVCVPSCTCDRRAAFSLALHVSSSQLPEKHGNKAAINPIRPDMHRAVTHACAYHRPYRLRPTHHLIAGEPLELQRSRGYPHTCWYVALTLPWPTIAVILTRSCLLYPRLCPRMPELLATLQGVPILRKRYCRTWALTSLRKFEEIRQQRGDYTLSASKFQ